MVHKGGNQMAIQFLLPNTSATHAKPAIGKAILCMGFNVS